LRLVDLQDPAVELLAVHLLHGLLCVLVAREGHEAEAARAARFTIGDDLHVVEFTEALERIAQSAVVCVPAEAADEESVSHVSSTF
jgi:hypothetical protein